MSLFMKFSILSSIAVQSKEHYCFRRAKMSWNHQNSFKPCTDDNFQGAMKPAFLLGQIVRQPWPDNYSSKHNGSGLQSLVEEKVAKKKKNVHKNTNTTEIKP